MIQPEYKKICGTIGLCLRAGRLVCGTENVLSSVRSGRALGVFAADDISENTKKKLGDCCRYYGAELYRLPFGMSVLSDALGKEGNVSSVSVLDEGFLKKLLETAGETRF